MVSEDTSFINNQSDAAYEIHVHGRPAAFLDQANNSVQHLLEKDFKRREFLVQGLERWLQKKYGNETLKLKPIMELFAELQNYYNSYKVLLSPERIVPQQYQEFQGFQTGVTIQSQGKSRKERNIGNVELNDLHFRIGVLAIEIGEDASNNIKLANCQVDHTVWRLYNLLYPDKLYAELASRDTSGTNTSLELARRFSRAVFPREFIAMLNAIELGNHDFTVHALFDDNPNISSSAGDIKKDYNLSEIPITAVINQIDGKAISQPPLSTKPDSDGTFSTMNIYEVLAFHLHAMAWKEVFSKQPEGPKIKKALLNQIKSLHYSLYGNESNQQSVLQRALSTPAIQNEFTPKQTQDAVGYVQKVQLNFLFNILDPQDPEVARTLAELGIHHTVSDKQRILHHENLLDELKLDVSKLLIDFHDRLKEAKPEHAKKKLVKQAEKLLAELGSDKLTISKQLDEMLPTIEKLLQESFSITDRKLLAHIFFATDQSEKALKLLIDTSFNTVDFGAPIAVQVNRCLNILVESSQNLPVDVLDFAKRIAVRIKQLPTENKPTIEEVDSIVSKITLRLGMLSLDGEILPITNSLLESLDLTEIQKLRTILSTMEWYAKSVEPSQVCSILADVTKRYSELNHPDFLLDTDPEGDPDNHREARLFMNIAEHYFDIGQFAEAKQVADFALRAVNPAVKIQGVSFSHLIAKLNRISAESEQRQETN